MIIIIETINGVTYYDYNKVLCFAHIKESDSLTNFHLSHIIEKEHSGSNMCDEQMISKLKKEYPKTFEKYIN